jgi:hypothetical protein
MAQTITSLSPTSAPKRAGKPHNPNSTIFVRSLGDGKYHAWRSGQSFVALYVPEIPEQRSLLTLEMLAVLTVAWARQAAWLEDEGEHVRAHHARRASQHCKRQLGAWTVIDVAKPYDAGSFVDDVAEYDIDSSSPLTIWERLSGATMGGAH